MEELGGGLGGTPARSLDLGVTDGLGVGGASVRPGAWHSHMGTVDVGGQHGLSQFLL